MKETSLICDSKLQSIVLHAERVAITIPSSKTRTRRILQADRKREEQSSPLPYPEQRDEIGQRRPEVPGLKLRGLLAKPKGVRGRERIETKLSQHLKVLQDKLGPKRAGHTGMEEDELFQSAYPHKHQDPAAYVHYVVPVNAGRI